MGHCRLHQVLYILTASHVRVDKQSIPATSEDDIVCCIISRIAVAVCCRICVGAHYVSTLTGKAECNRSTNPGR